MKVPHPPTRRILSFLAAALPVAVPALAFAESGRHGAHVHGVAELTVAWEGRQLELELNSPAMSIVGFEHRASNPEQAKAVENAASTLRDGEALFTIMGTECELVDADVDMSAVERLGAIGGEDDNNDGDTDTSGHDHHEDHADHDGIESHSDIRARYEYLCSDTSELQSLRVGAAGLPFGLETINVMWVSERGQGGTELNEYNQLVELN